MQLPKEIGSIHQSSQLASDWQIDSNPLPLSEGPKYAVICVDTTSGLTQAFLCQVQSGPPSLVD